MEGPTDPSKDSALTNQSLEGGMDKQDVENAFFNLLEKDLEKMGYLLLRPLDKSKYAATRDTLLEWEEDERDAGLL